MEPVGKAIKGRVLFRARLIKDWQASKGYFANARPLRQGGRRTPGDTANIFLENALKSVERLTGLRRCRRGGQEQSGAKR